MFETFAPRGVDGKETGAEEKCQSGKGLNIVTKTKRARWWHPGGTHNLKPPVRMKGKRSGAYSSTWTGHKAGSLRLGVGSGS